MGRFGSVLVAMVTPFDDDLELDLEAAVTLARWLVDQGADGLVLAGTLVPVGLSACAAGGGSDTPADAAPTGEVSDTNPFGVGDGAAVEAVIFDGGYGTDYVSAVAATYADLHKGGKLTVAPSTPTDSTIPSFSSSLQRRRRSRPRMSPRIESPA